MANVNMGTERVGIRYEKYQLATNTLTNTLTNTITFFYKKQLS